ncbi:TPA: pyruvate kinase [Candidatus Gracilibacteria bacterium]|nr:pyruvate kinase [Candidatus Gracilibacteria bacterium]
MTKIVATLGLVSDSKEKILELANAGVEIFRLNFSHGSHAWHKKCIETIRSVQPNAVIMLDTKGPEMRTGDIINTNGKPSFFTITKGEVLELVSTIEEQDVLFEKSDTKNKKLFINHKNFVNDVEAGDVIALNSGLQNLEVIEVNTDKKIITTQVLQSGKIKSRRHVNLVGKDVSLSTTTEIDKHDIIFGLEQGIDCIAMSFVRHAADIEYVQNICDNFENKNDKKIKIYAKIETQEAMNNLEEIAKIADGLMVARGDLGVETPFEFVPAKRKQILKTGKKYNCEVIVATEMLESMITKPRPTRAEVSDITFAVWQNADYTMLSGETAAGNFPLESVQVMKKVIDAAIRTK